MNKLLAITVAAAMLAGTSGAMAADKKFNVSTNPFALAFQNYNLEVDYKLTDKLTVAPSFNTWSFDLGGYSLGNTGFGVRANYFTKAANQTGPYVSGLFRYNTYSIETTSFIGTAKGEASAMSFGANAGYWWFWDTINMRLGGGYSIGTGGDVTLTYSNATTTTYDGSGLGSGVNFDFTVGYAF